jgi:FKBP-type peptidyl-prolyl cis-trans isomerase SlyD
VKETRRLLACGLGLAVGLAAGVGLAADERDPAAPSENGAVTDAPEVQPGAVVHLEFTLRDGSGAVLDDNRGRPPLVFTVGQREVIPGLEKALAGMKVGEERRITVLPEEGYGPVDPAAVTEVPTERVPPELRTVGARLVGQTRNGREMPVRVREIKETSIVLDLNHPLAGRTLVFDVRIILIEPP